MNQRVPVHVADSIAFRNACSLRSLDEGVHEQCVRVDHLQVAAAKVKDFRTVQLRAIVLLCAGISAMGDVEGMNAPQLRMWLLEHACRPHFLPWSAAARIILYLCVSSDGLPLPILVDIALLDYAMDVQSRNVSLNPSSASMYRAAVPCMIHSCARMRIACASQRLGACDGVLWKIAWPGELLTFLEAAGDMKVDQARARLIEYFEGGMKRLMPRLNHSFHDHTLPNNRVVSQANDAALDADSAAAQSTATVTPDALAGLYPSSLPLFNLRRMSEGAQLALALGQSALISYCILQRLRLCRLQVFNF